jgi:hypothetical protein
VLINWSNVAKEHRSQYYEWHDRHHMEGRIRLPGFQRGRRLWSVDADRDVLNLYEVDDMGVLTGGAYSEKASKPSSLYRSTGKIITDAIRGLAHVRYSQGTALGSQMLTIRCGIPQETTTLPRLIGDVLPRVQAIQGVVGTHICVADDSASNVLTNDRVGRPTAIPAWCIMVESTIPEALELCKTNYTSISALQGLGAEDVVLGTYALQMAMTKRDLEKPTSGA